MGLQSTLNKIVKKVYTTSLGDIPKDVIHVSISHSHSTVTGVTTLTETTTQTIKAVVGRVSDKYLIQGLAKQEDKQISFAALDLTTTPKIGDRFTIASVDYKCIILKLDPSDSNYTAVIT